MGLNINDLVVAFAAVWESSIDDYELVSREEFSVQDKMSDIIHLLYKYKGKIEFSQTLIRKGTKSEVIAAFLALLELVKLQRVIISQQERFSDYTYYIERVNSKMFYLQYKKHVEALLFVSGDPITTHKIAQILEIPEEHITLLIEQLIQDMADDHRGLTNSKSCRWLSIMH
jgi:hypothetical protein